MNSLTDKQYWDSFYLQKQKPSQSANNEGLCQKKSIVERLRTTPFRGYADYLLWERIYPKFLSNKEGAKVVEIGSAPGKELVRMHKVFGLNPYGIEYSLPGVELNQSIFIRNGLNPENVIHADFLAGQIDKKFMCFFDVVFSNGFIEHFDNPEEVVCKHVNLLKKGGLLIIGIPNLRGLNRAMQYFFERSLLRMHNLGIMEKEKFTQLFDKELLSIEYCGYYGTFNFNLFIANRPFRKLILNCCKVIQLLLNAVFRLLFGKKGKESKTFSPYLICVGIRK
jgi:SAM-dependent methyltransferase